MVDPQLDPEINFYIQWDEIWHWFSNNESFSAVLDLSNISTLTGKIKAYLVIKKYTSNCYAITYFGL